MNLIISSLLLPIVIAATPPAGPTAAPTASAHIQPTPAAAAINAFSLDLYRRVAADPGESNLVLSPFSVACCLSLALPGARGETAAQMRRVLHQTGEPADSCPDLAALSRALPTANALWGERTLAFRRTYLSRLDDCFGTGAVHPADFAAQPEAERRRINEWVAHATHDRIPDLLGSGSISSQTILALVNAIYLEADWEHPFVPLYTSAQPFHRADGSEAMVSLMRRHEAESVGFAAFRKDGSYFETPTRYKMGDSPKNLEPGAGGFLIVEERYRGDELSMILLVPHEAGGLPAIERMLEAEHLDRWLDQLVVRQVRVELPRFRLETARALNSTLAALGMPAAFDSTRADFSGMFEAGDQSRAASGAWIGLVQHSAVVDVDEEGTTAAAATASVLACDAAVEKWIDYIPTVRADRPFFFAIRDRRSGALLFVGRLAEPVGA